MISLRQISKELFAEKTRLLLTILAVAWATTAIASMLAVGQGLRLTFRHAMSGVGDGVIYIRSGHTSHNYQGQTINQKVLLTKQDYATIKNAIPEIKAISPEYSFYSSLEAGKEKVSTTIYAVNPIYSAIRNIIPQANGRFINQLDMQQRRRVIILGNELAGSLFKTRINPIGKSVFIHQEPFTIVGVMQKKFQMAGSNDANQAWIPTSTYVMLASPSRINSIVLTPKHLDQGSIIKEQIRHILANQKQLDPNDKNIIRYRDFENIQSKTNLIFTGMQLFLGFVGTLTLIVAGVGIANVMLIAVNRATREIGIRMAIGARGYQILMHYVIEALFATAIGGVIGLIAAKGLTYSISLIPMHGKFFQIIGKPIPILSPEIMLIIISILGLIGFLAGIFPARKAARIDPAEALRH